MVFILVRCKNLFLKEPVTPIHLSGKQQLVTVKRQRIDILVSGSIDFDTQILRVETDRVAYCIVTESRQIKHFSYGSVVESIAPSLGTIPLQQRHFLLVETLLVIKPRQRDGGRRKHHRI